MTRIDIKGLLIQKIDIWRQYLNKSWWRHQMETFSALLVICAGNSPACEFPAQRPVTRSFDVFFDLCLNKWLSEHSWAWWFESLSRLLWRHCNGIFLLVPYTIYTSSGYQGYRITSISLKHDKYHPKSIWGYCIKRHDAMGNRALYRIPKAFCGMTFWYLQQ